MKPEHRAWIDDYQRSVNGDTYGKCHAACKAMQIDFPDLKLVRGHVSCPLPGAESWPRGRGRPHWWLVDPATEEIVDPTKNQFGIFVVSLLYEPHDEGQPEPTGKCPNCGGYCYGGNQTCSDQCFTEYAAYLTQGLRQ